MIDNARVTRKEGERDGEFNRRVVASARRRVESLLVRCLRELVYRNRGVHVGSPTCWSDWGTYLSERARGRLWVSVDGFRFAFEWTCVREKGDDSNAHNTWGGVEVGWGIG